MRFLDANIFLRYLDTPTDDISRRRNVACSALFERVESGEEEITTSEVVLAEVFWVLTTKRHAGLPRPEVAEKMSAIIGFRGFRLSTKRRCQRALAMVHADPKLSFVDALVACTVKDLGHRLLAYDSDFDRIDGLTREEP